MHKKPSLKTLLLEFLLDDKKKTEKIILQIISLRPLKVVDSYRNLIEIANIEDEVNDLYEFDLRNSYALILNKWNYLFKKVPNSTHDYYYDIDAQNYK